MATPASAALKLCNRTSYVLYAATGSIVGDGAVTQGWSRILPGACQMPMREALNKGRYFVYARSSLAHAGISRAWGGDRELCAKDANFAMRVPANALRCPADDMFMLPFAAIDTKRQKSWAMTLDETPAFKSLQDAERAGLKRLLRDQGAKIGSIDAKPDKASDAAMAAFRKRLNINPKASTADLYDALETEALKTTAPAGYAICNDTAKAIWAALGMRSKDKWISRGWWKIAAGGCAKALTETLTTDKVFLLAQTPGGIPIVYGKEKFCTTNVEFDIQGRGNCKSRGLVEAGFAETRVKGLPGFTAHVSEHGLIYMPKTYSGAPK
ncbi:MAG TPA: DUF1036 domain-containing protein [Rhizomicrobium sp.]|nr:DUF1036 domain-containing protein [Rhizomicrobium sp.]